MLGVVAVVAMVAVPATALASTPPGSTPEGGSVIGQAYAACTGVADEAARDAEAAGRTLLDAQSTIESALRFITYDDDAVVIEGAYNDVGHLGAGFEGTWFDSDYITLMYNCMNAVLGMPLPVRTHLAQTRALDGVQEDSWNGISAALDIRPRRRSRDHLLDKRARQPAAAGKRPQRTRT